MYVALGLAGEVGEVCNKIKKVIRDDRGIVTPLVQTQLAAELGDCFWYLARLTDELKLKSDVILQNNMDKLNSRKARGKLKGSGDVR